MTIAVVCVMGLPGAGKTSLCRALSQNMMFKALLRSVSQANNVEIEVISFDEVESQMRDVECKGFSPKAWRYARQRVTEFVSSRCARDSADDSGSVDVVLLDDNFYYRSMRKRFRPHGTIFIDRSIDQCLTSNSMRLAPVPVSVLERMAMNLEKPESTDRQPVLTLVSTECAELSDMVTAVVSAVDFWFGVHQSALSGNRGMSEEPGPLSFREKILNEGETRFRRCVSQVASKVKLSPTDVKAITRLKARFLTELKAEISQQSELSAVMDALDALAVRFNSELAQFSYCR